MIDKQMLEQMSALNREIEDLESRIQKIDNKTIGVVSDSVQGSSKEYPYIQHNCKIEGYDCIKNLKHKNTKRKYKKQIESKRYKLEKLINSLEYELNYIEDSEIRQIIRYRYEDNMNWIQIMFKMKYKAESTAKMKLKRFFKENDKCDKCDDKTC